MGALSSTQRNAEVAPECLFRSRVIRKKRDNLERALKAEERGRGRKKRREGAVGSVIMVGCIST